MKFEYKTNIGDIIKWIGFAIGLTGSIVALVYGIIYMGTESGLIGLLIIVAGIIGALITAALIYGFGELISTNCHNQTLLEYQYKRSKAKQPVSKIKSKKALDNQD